LESGSIIENVLFGYPKELLDLSRLSEVLMMSQLDQFITASSNGIDSQVGMMGSELSGGEKQRIGLARALYLKPKLLVLDEATSALDASTENVISQTLKNKVFNRTTIVIAHRLATVKECDLLIYLEKGKILATGTFDEVRKAIPDFDSQASLMGL
jgi:ABC-type multidrug transport system fused ATPase/permease subunit